MLKPGNMRPLKALPAAILALSLAAAAAFGEAPRDTDTRALIDELRALIAQAEAARAADPRFLEDLRAALRRYGTAWPVTLLEDDFGDGDYTRNPAWTVRSGDYFIDRRHGLRRRMAPTAAIGADAGDLMWGPPTDPDWAGEADAQGQDGAPDPVAASTGRAEISTAFALTNAFSMRLELRGLEAGGRFSFGPYQGSDGTAYGYRLDYAPGRRLELVAVSHRGVRVVAARDQALNLADGAAHRLEWNRWPDGIMTVSVDGREIIRVADRGFTDPFDGVTFIVAGGDYALRSILIRGAP